MGHFFGPPFIMMTILKMERRNTKMLIVNLVRLTFVLSLMSFLEIDITEKNQDDDTDDVEIGKCLEDSNFENGKDKCEAVIA